ncbi:MAG: hypothetical protein ABEH77_10825 [Halobacteriaceae archaeon]
MASGADDLEAVIGDALGGDATVLWLDDRVRPHRLYAAFRDNPPSPALYVEFEVDGELLEVVVHNFADYERAMGRWNLDPVDLLVLNELHELTHWAMTDAERERWDALARRTGRPDGYWFNRVLLDLLEHLDGRERRGRESLLGRARRWLGR